jgi:hypothetical protein
MPKFNVTAKWEVCGDIEVEAINFAEALKMVTTHPCYVQDLTQNVPVVTTGSIKIQHDMMAKEIRSQMGREIEKLIKQYMAENIELVKKYAILRNLSHADAAVELVSFVNVAELGKF